jgi:ATP-dependent DNA helicase RecG
MVASQAFPDMQQSTAFCTDTEEMVQGLAEHLYTFKIIIPLSFGSMTKVCPGTSPVASAQVGKSSGEVGGEVIRVNLDVQKLNALLAYCKEARSRTEMQSFCGIKSQDYFRRNILLPLLESGRLKRTIPDKPNSSKQKYIRA